MSNGDDDKFKELQYMFPFDPSSSILYKVIHGVFGQIVDIFPSSYLHLGGDEVNLDCWSEGTRLVNACYYLDIAIFFFNIFIFSYLIRWNIKIKGNIQMQK